MIIYPSVVPSERGNCSHQKALGGGVRSWVRIYNLGLANMPNHEYMCARLARVRAAPNLHLHLRTPHAHERGRGHA